ncbi:hypothetical protein D1831_05200 [Lactiplantibacillus garii]|uniref:Glycosyltransferase RgtA/B/C/D-like domain-containing protein n=1 Tax=Lactiplantibacillus garii TaxID=2306423 RepID=A0A426D881_9LACO|nr:glycosyltransferase family 39 protein [Lactiplantibacillus garii]RRK10829.1 hypothetical protein D1831_05200 [Lactiplantibacillus garii]
MFRRGLVKIIQAFTLAVAGFLLLWMLMANWYFEWHSSIKVTTGAVIGSVLISSLLLLVVIGGSYWLGRQKTSWIIGSFTGLTALKFPVVAWLKIAPTSDFWNYHTLAAFNAQGLTWQRMLERGDLGSYVIFPHALNIANFFSFSTALAGDNFFISQFINISCTFLDMLLLYWLVARWLSRRMGVLASLIFYCIPAYWLYSTLLNGAEPLFLTCVLLTMFALTRVVVPLPTATTNDQWLNLVLAWVATVVANMVRPVMTIWLIALVIFTLALGLQSTKVLRQHGKKILLYVGATVLVMAASTGIYSWLYGFQVAPSSVTAGYSLAIGTSNQTKGMYDPQIASQVNRELKVTPNLTRAYPRIAKTMQRDVQKNLTALRGQEIPFINQKMRGLMGEDYGYNWVLYNLSHAKSQRKTAIRWYQLKGLITIVSYNYFQVMLVLALGSVGLGLGVLFKKNYLNNYFFYSALLLDGFTISSLIMEVQGRYHVILYLPIIFLIICGGAAMASWIHSKQLNRTTPD